MDLIDIQLYSLPSGKEPFTDWEERLSRDVQSIMQTRLARIRGGNFGDSKSIGQGIYELRIQYGPGYRIYYGKRGKTVVILLCGGDKSSQKKDIKKALAYWEDCLQCQKKRKN